MQGSSEHTDKFQVTLEKNQLVKYRIELNIYSKVCLTSCKFIYACTHQYVCVSVQVTVCVCECAGDCVLVRVRVCAGDSMRVRECR